jgi:hypothetical protein
MSEEELSRVVNKDLVTFSLDEIPEQMLNKLADYKVVMLGEVHYIKEYAQFLSKIATELSINHDFQTFLIESPHAFNWIVEDYSLGLMPEVDDEIANKLIYSLFGLRGIREHNLQQDSESMLSVHSIDLNHKKGYFLWSLKTMKEYVKADIIDEIFKECINAEEFSYTTVLNKYKSILIDDFNKTDNDLEEKWRIRLIEMIDVELVSNNCRNYILENQVERRYIERENYLKETIDKFLKVSDKSVLINMGTTHLQKRPVVFLDQEWVGQYLSEKSPYSKNNVYCINVSYKKGTFRSGKFDMRSSNNNLDLHRVMSNYIDNNIGFLSFDDDLFKEEALALFSNQITPLTPPRLVYDGFVMLPKATYDPSILELLKEIE